MSARPAVSVVAGLLSLALCFPSVACAEEPKDPATAADAAANSPEAPAAEAPRPPEPARPAAGSMDFDLFDDGTKKPAAPGLDLRVTSPNQNPEMIARISRRRRLILQLHQGFGFATLALLAATVVIGQLNYVDKYGGDFTNRYQTVHLGLATASTALFAVDAGLALFAPTPYKKPIRADAALVHKIMMGVAAAGFITEIILGPLTAAKAGDLHQRDFALGHVVTGYVTFASMLGGYLAYVF